MKTNLLLIIALFASQCLRAQVGEMKASPMRTTLMTLLLTVTLMCFAQKAVCQGSFVNLDFENPILPLTPGADGRVPIEDALPGWTSYIGGVTNSGVAYDTISLGAAEISIHDTNGFEPILQGNYTVLMQGSFSGGTIVPVLAQVGTIPSNAKSITYYGEGPFTVTFSGHLIPVVPIGSGPNYTIFGGDISAFAGQTGELRLQGGDLLDNITFSPSVIPEPSMLAVFAVGGLMIGCCSIRRLRGSCKGTGARRGV